VKSILLVCQYAPPSSLVPARRIGGLTKYLARLGYKVTVLTSALSGEGPIEGAADVVTTQDLMTSRLNWRRGSFDALGGGVPAPYKRRSTLEDVIVPDVGLATWLPYVLPRALRLASERSFDCVVTSSPPQSVHLVGRALRRRGLPWIAELRDGWTFDPPRPPWPLKLQARLDAALERSTLAQADVVVGVTDPIVDDVRRRLGLRAELVTNAFDPEEAAEPEAVADFVRDGRHLLVHTGRMAVSGRTPGPLLDALARVRSDRLDVVLAGPLSEDERPLIERAESDGLLRWVGVLDRSRTLALQRAADSLLVLARGASGKSVATGKLFEYLGARRPILVLGEDTEAARIVREAGAGTATSATDPEAIAGALAALADGPPPPADPAAIERYGFPAVAARLAELLDEVAS
jgi:glycosyltransferase involved in cell wall biosynthesis